MRILSVILFLIGSVAESLKMFRVDVPHHVLNGESVTLKCQFSLEKKEHIYSVRWYKDNEEFFRYLPRFKPQIVAHKVEGVHVDKEKSSNQMVTLNPVEMRSTGVYRCEVSLEAPYFTSDQGEGRMNVVYLPTEGPQITGNIKDEYEVGETLDLNCISSKSSPPAKISWYINDSPVPEMYEPMRERYMDNSLNITAVDNLYSTQLRLRIVLKPDHFRSNGIAKVRCRAVVLASHDRDELSFGNSPHMMDNGRIDDNDLFIGSPYQQVRDHHVNSHPSGIFYDKEATFIVRSSSLMLPISLQLILTAVTFVLYSWISS